MAASPPSSKLELGPFTADHRQSLASQGFCKIAGYFNADELTSLTDEVHEMIQRWYTKEHLDSHAVYPSDRTDSRESHAMMIAKGPSPFPKVDHTACPTIDRFLSQQSAILEDITGKAVSPASRFLLNYQHYKTASKPVGEHFDGEYLKADKAADGVEFSLLEGILPRFVVVLVVKDQNQGRGLEIIDNHPDAPIKVYQPELNSGDLVIFDNIKLRHRVPQLAHGRISMGLRNFDHVPLHFAKNEHHMLEGCQYREIPEGFVSEDADCAARFRTFFDQEWPALRDDYSSYV